LVGAATLTSLSGRAGVAELVDAVALGATVLVACRFDSCPRYHHPGRTDHPTIIMIGEIGRRRLASGAQMPGAGRSVSASHPSIPA